MAPRRFLIIFTKRNRGLQIVLADCWSPGLITAKRLNDLLLVLTWAPFGRAVQWKNHEPAAKLRAAPFRTCASRRGNSLADEQLCITWTHEFLSTCMYLHSRAQLPKECLSLTWRCSRCVNYFCTICNWWSRLFLVLKTCQCENFTAKINCYCY